MHTDLAKVAVDRLQSVAMVDYDAIAIDAKRSCVHDPSIIRRFNANMLRGREIISQMHLLVDLVSFVDIISRVGKG